MANTLVIAEKPSLGREIAGMLGIQTRLNTHLLCAGEVTVTWAFGHLYEMAMPDAYLQNQNSGPQGPAAQSARWRAEDLPIIPQKWQFHPRRDAAAQLKVIATLAAKADVVVNAGDADREGQLLIDEIIERMRLKSGARIRRIWLHALDAASIKSAWAGLEDNARYLPYSAAALARSKSDWLVGMNLSRAMSIKSYLTLPGGRVQSPTAILVAARDDRIDNFTSHDFFIPWADFATTTNEKYRGFWIKPEEVSPGSATAFDEEGRLTNSNVAERIAAAANSTTAATVLSFGERIERRQPELPYNLSTLQKIANARHGISPGRTLEATQRLYEKKLVSYPRTDCRYYDRKMLAGADAILAGLRGTWSGYLPASARPDMKLVSPAWNSAKVAESSHFGLAPTGEKPGSLGGDETYIYELILRSYLRQFFPPERSRMREAVTAIDLGPGKQLKFKSTGHHLVDPGWTVCEPPQPHPPTTPVSSQALKPPRAEKNTEDNTTLPKLTNGQQVRVAGAGIEVRKTAPPARFTEGTLIDAMGQVHRHLGEIYAYLDKIRGFKGNPAVAARLKESSGIGTQATRTNILEGLCRHGLLVTRGKQVMATDLARFLAKVAPVALIDPGMTAYWEDKLSEIAAGELDAARFMQVQEDTVRKLTSAALAADYAGAGDLRRRMADAKSRSPDPDNSGTPASSSRGKPPRRRAGRRTGAASH